LHIEHLSGEVLDASGAAIEHAKILLFDPAQALVEQLQSDSEGKFTSQQSLTGTYQFVVSSAGFTPLRGRLHVAPTANPPRHSALTVQLGVRGSCSAADVQ
jgi:hypothetical protein